MAAGLFLPFLAILISLSDMPDAAVPGDDAVLELLTRQTARGENLLGPYSRFRFNHPGPIYFLLMIPLYYLSGQAHGSFLLTSVLINLGAVLLIFLVVRRLTGPTLLAVATLLSLYLAYLGPENLHSSWNPTVTILSFGSALFCFAAGVSGRPLFLFPAIGLLSFAIQSHVAYLPPASLVALAAAVVFHFPKSVGGVAGHPKDWRLWAALLFLLLLLWSPTVFQELASENGNLSAMLSFFTLGHQPTATPVTLRILGQQLTSSLWDGSRSGLDSSTRLWLSALLMLGLPVAYYFSRRRGNSLAASLCLLCLTGLVGALFAVRRIVGPVHGYLVGWTSVLGLVGSAAIVMAFVPALAGIARRLRATLHVVLVGLFLIVAVANFRTGWGPNHLTEWPNLPVHRNIERLARETVERLREHGTHKAQVRIATDSSWPTAAGLVLQLEKRGMENCVEDSWAFLFGAALVCSQHRDEILIVGDSRFSLAARHDTRFQLVSESPEDAIYLCRNVPEPSLIDFSGLDSLLYLKHGFTEISQIEPGQGRWSMGLSSSLLLPLTPNRSYVLKLSARPLPVRGLVQSITVMLNDQRLTRFPMVEKELTYLISLPAEHVRQVNDLRFEYAYAEPPMWHHDDSTDWRRLAVFFRQARIVPADSPDEAAFERRRKSAS